MLEAALIATVAGVLALAVMVFRSSRLLERLGGVVPDRSLVERLAGLQESLARSLDAQRQAVEQLPRQVAGAVSGEIRPLAESLQRSHDHFSAAVLTLDQEGSLSEWVGGIRDAVQPLQAVSAAVERHYETAGKVLHTTSGLVEQWASQREAVVHAFEAFAETVERSSAAETTHLRDIEHRVMNRLEEVAETNANVAHSLSELQVASRQAAETQTGLGRSVETTVVRTGELIDLGKQTQGQLHELMRAQQAGLQELGRFQKDADQGMLQLRSSIGQIAEATTQSLEQARQEAARSVHGLQNLLGEFHRRHGEKLSQLEARQEAVARREEEAAREQKALAGELRGLLTALPERRMQKLAAVLLAVQIALTAAILIRLIVS